MPLTYIAQWQDPQGRYHEVGMNYQIPFIRLKTVNGVLRNLSKTRPELFAKGLRIVRASDDKVVWQERPMRQQLRLGEGENP